MRVYGEAAREPPPTRRTHGPYASPSRSNIKKHGGRAKKVGKSFAVCGKVATFAPRGRDGQPEGRSRPHGIKTNKYNVER